ncbi:hypothetical protein [Limosilactobacillus vaginalis]|uniref:hypothetical protein n=1 Tax=Limosilactobacillus vaginalis TaxID=1633 RepID=UPI003F245992
MVMMKIDEFIEKVNRNDRMEAEEIDGVITIYNDSDHEVIDIPNGATNLLEIDFIESYSRYNFGKPSREYLSALIEEFLHTPIKERFPEKKYRVRLRGFNSDNGHQYLTTKKTDGESRVFACALRTDLKQEFTFDEINKIINRPAFKGTWVLDMIRAGIESVDE